MPPWRVFAREVVTSVSRLNIYMSTYLALAARCLCAALARVGAEVETSVSRLNIYMSTYLALATRCLCAALARVSAGG